MKGVERSLSAAEQLQSEGDPSDVTGRETKATSTEAKGRCLVTSSSSVANAAKDPQQKNANATTNTNSIARPIASDRLPTDVAETSGGGSAKKVSTSDAPSSIFPPYFSRTSSVDTGAAFGVTTATAKQEVSFLDSLTDEERRTRSRLIPNVQGFRRLHKSEIKHDLKVAKTFGGFAIIDDDEGLEWNAPSVAATDDESISTRDISEESAVSDEIGSTNASNEETSGPFVVPCTYSDVVRDICEASNATTNAAEASKIMRRISFRSPKTVEAISAFNPPRPPESCASIKKKRMVRWEHNPQDVTQDLTKYKKMVLRTRSQLQKTELERQRVEDVGEHLRLHYFHLLKSIREESNAIERETQQLQLKAALEAELMATRTRSKGSNSMRDVLSVLRSRGEKISSLKKNLRDNESVDGSNSPNVPVSLCPEKDNACRFLVPGDLVLTSYGTGIVQKVFGFRVLGTKADGIEAPRESDVPQDANTPFPPVIPPNVCVRLSFGVLYASPNEIHPLTKTNSATDVNLLSRWKTMMSNFSAQFYLDLTGTDNIPIKDGYEYPSNDAAPFYSNSYDTTSDNAGDQASALSLEAELVSAVESHSQDERSKIERKGMKTARQDGGHRLIPVMGGTLPVAGHHGSLLDECSLLTVQDSLDRTLNSGEGVLGKPSNTFVTSELKDWEFRRQQLYNMKGKVLTLRNQLAQERRARTASERAHGISQERMERVDMLLSEMKADLQSLKNRLQEELTQLGISQNRAREMLSAAVEENCAYSSVDRPRKRVKKSPDLGVESTVPRTSRRKSDEGMKLQGESISYVNQQEYSANLLSRRGKRGRVEESNMNVTKKRSSRR